MFAVIEWLFILFFLWRFWYITVPLAVIVAGFFLWSMYAVGQDQDTFLSGQTPSATRVIAYDDGRPFLPSYDFGGQWATSEKDCGNLDLVVGITKISLHHEIYRATKVEYLLDVLRVTTDHGIVYFDRDQRRTGDPMKMTVNAFGTRDTFYFCGLDKNLD
jgi:hypothetical protein